MNDFQPAKPSKLVPILVGSGAMIAISSIPILNLVNLLCCAGIMGGAVLGVWYYQRMFPPQLPFTVGDGVTVGALSGVLAGVVSPTIEMLSAGMFSEDFAFMMEDRIAEAFENPEISGADPVAMQEAMDVVMQLMQNPAVLFVIIIAASLLIYAGFGALGGVIGGNIFKTKVVPEDQLPMR